ncbi:MAG TPA: hypothetical protein VEJ18_18185, partial [Planctomycetota bacterium]|nr:hypothetical protein [Planctomycetota bacterium]
MAKACANHPDSPSVADCGQCGKSCCLMCVEEADGASYCSAACAQARQATQAQQASARAHVGPCVNHPASPAVDRCQVCEKAVCLLCLQDTPEGSFCSTKCHDVMKEVRGWVETPSAPAKAPAPAPAVKAAPPPAPPPPPPAAPPPSPRPATRVPVPGPTVPCARCGKAVIRAQAIESSWAHFCSDACAQAGLPARETAATPAPVERRSAGVPPAVLGGAIAAVVLIGVIAVMALTNGTPPPIAQPGAAQRPDVPPATAVKPTTKVEPRPEPPSPPTPAPAPAVAPERPVTPAAGPHVTRAKDPWDAEAPGAWFRYRRSAGGRETYSDVALKERGPWYRLLTAQEKTKDAPDPEYHVWNELQELYPRGDLLFKGIAIDLLARAVDGKEVVLWVVREGPHAGVILKSESPQAKVSIARVGQETLRVKDRSFDCLVVETEAAEGRPRETRWLSPACPAGPVKILSEGMTQELVDWGGRWESRPPFPGTVIAKGEPKPAVPAEPKPAPKPEPTPVVKIEPK